MDWTSDDHYQLNLDGGYRSNLLDRDRAGSIKIVEIAVTYTLCGLKYNWRVFEEPVRSYSPEFDVTLASGSVCRQISLRVARNFVRQDVCIINSDLVENRGYSGMLVNYTDITSQTHDHVLSLIGCKQVGWLLNSLN